jgi:hypothetical protein
VRAILAYAVAAAAIVFCACGESRRPIGEECLRDDDCLSGVCAARTCVSAPPLVTGASNPPPDEEPRIPDGGSGGAGADAPSDAKTGG